MSVCVSVRLCQGLVVCISFRHTLRSILQVVRNVESIRWLYTQRVKLHLNNKKENETDIEKEWENLQNIIKSAANESLGTIKNEIGESI